MANSQNAQLAQSSTEMINPKKPARFFDKNSIRTRLILAFMGTVLFTALIISLSSIVIGFQTGQQRVINELGAVAALKENEIKTWVDSLHEDLTALSTQEDALLRMRALLQPTAFRVVISNELRGNFEQTMALAERFDELFLVDLDGKIVASTDPAREGQLETEQPYLQQGQKGNFLQPPSYAPNHNEISMFVSRPIFHQRGQFLGLLVGRANLDKLNEIMRQQNSFSRASRAYLVDANNVLITEAGLPDAHPGRVVVESEGALAALAKNEGHGVYDDYRGVSVIGAYRWLPDLQVALLSEQNQAEALRPILATGTTNIIIAVIAVAIAVLVGLQITRSISRPLNNLADTSTRIAAGDFNLRARVERDDEIGDVARAFNLMTERLRELINTLEDRVKERTQALETAAEISLQLTTLLDTDELLQYVIERIQTEFEFYHAHIYLLDEPTGDLVMVWGSGEVGRRLKEKGHRLSVGQGIVGTVAQTDKPLISNDVTKMPNFVRNPLLSDTRSEIAVPLRKGEKVLGVLDIQSEQLNRFTHEDLSLLQSIANQTATALDNARLLADTKEALQKVERLNQQITRQGWQKFQEELTASGYRFQRERNLVIPDLDTWLPPMKQAAIQKKLIKQTGAGNGDDSKAELAVPLILRGEVIGVLGVKREETLDWAEEEISAVETVAGQIARALENARLSKEQEKTIVQLQEVDRLKSEFLTSMSHELRTPLNSIIGFADVLLQGIDGELNELALHDIQLIYNSGQHLLALINDILDLSKIEAGKMELVREPLNVKSIVDDVLAATNSLVKDKPVAIKTNVSDTLPAVYADKLRLNQILLNLVSNAAKFTKAGEINISAKVSEHEPDKMFISVADTGIGIPANKLRTIFDRFSQADSSTTRQYGGTGLGLPICLQLVEMHGGKIGVTSAERFGSTFYFTIPLAEFVAQESAK